MPIKAKMVESNSPKQSKSCPEALGNDSKTIETSPIFAFNLMQIIFLSESEVTDNCQSHNSL